MAPSASETSTPDTSTSRHSPSAPGTPAQVLEFYTGIRAAHESAHAALLAQRTRINWLLLALIAIVVPLTYRASHGGSGWPLLLSFAGLAFLINRHMRIGTALLREMRLIALYDRNIARVAGTETQSGVTGETHRIEQHLYERDLNLLGPNSLFGLLDTVRTGVGQRGLAAILQSPSSHSESLARQAAVRELTPRNDLREAIAVLGSSKFQQVEASLFDTWLAEPTPVFHPAFRILLVLTSGALVVLLALVFFHVYEWSVMARPLGLVALAQTAMIHSLRRRVKPILDTVAKLSNHVQMFAEGLALLDRQTFDSPRLRALQETARQPANATGLLSRLQSNITIVQQRTKEIFYAFSALFAAGTQSGIAIAAWKRANGPDMTRWLAAWGEFEALSALANFAFEHPDHAWPELLPPSSEPVFQAQALGHPLLAAAVTNDVTLAPTQRFLLISGSNMSGKSTLLRAIGINAVLAYAGAPVHASSMRLTPLTLGSSLALTDSLAEGKSKFLAEVQRLSHIVEAGKSAPVLFLVDEIFSGTNSEDRRTAAGAVLRTLLRHGAIGALSTHDLALTDLATPTNTGLNVHMASPDPDDPLAFDYKLKPGVNTSSNALAIVRMMGLPTSDLP